MILAAPEFGATIPAGSFSSIVDMVISRSSFQKKKILHDLANRDTAFFTDANTFATSYSEYLDSQDIPIEYAVEAYLEMCRNMMKCQIAFMKTGRYTVSDHGKAFDEVYSNPNRMTSYMIGLAISQFLWRTHYEMYCCLRAAIKRYCPTAGSYLEVGPGHGLFMKEAVSSLPSYADIVAVDISPVSMSITKSIMEYFLPKSERICYQTSDMLLMDSVYLYDFITMGEVLEHVDFPDKLLQKLNTLLSANGRAFVSTCVNAPAIDHVYHFKYVHEIRSLISDCGFLIEEERVLPVENLPMDKVVRDKIAINYCAILKKKTRHDQIR
jgi:2-polyprenyl-3-methyl-5-hydroxy-6-metoxy-1,4-benzoquinol methylase